MMFERKVVETLVNTLTSAQTEPLEKPPHIGNTGWSALSKIPSFWRNAII